MEPKYTQFSRGDVVEDRYGRLHTVDEQVGCQVFLEPEPNCQHPWFHPSNITLVKRSATWT